MATILITGGGRGIGLELAKQLAELPHSRVSTIFVTTRGPPSQELQNLMSASANRIVNIHCEVTNEAGVKQAAAEIESQLGGKGLDILVNNVGMMPMTPDGIRCMDGNQLLETFDVNVVSAHRMTTALLALLQKGESKRIIMVSSVGGSIAYADRYGWLPVPEYKITKAAMNMLAVQYAIEYKPLGFTVLAINPGYLRTDMGTEKADLDVPTGINAVKELILTADSSMNGQFRNIRVPGWEHATGPNQYNGAEIPW